MTEAKHTPGPWKAIRRFLCDGDQDRTFWDIRPESWAAGSIASVLEGNADPEPNARLMAAGPDLLAALEGVVNDFRGFCIQTGKEMRYPAPIKMAMEAIQKAKGN